MITLYEPTMQSDLMLAKLYTEIIYSRDLDRLLAPDARTLSGFMKLCQPPNVCLLGTDEGLENRDGAWMWANFEPCFSGAFVGMWIKAERRGSKGSLTAVVDILEAGLKDFSILLNITHQNYLLEEHEKFGYSLVGEIPLLWAGRSVWLLKLTPGEFHASRAYQTMRRISLIPVDNFQEARYE
jgi:hypothetical protein